MPIPGTTKLPHLEENIGAAELRFTAGELDEFRTALEEIEIIGLRGPANVVALSDVEAVLKIE